MFDIFWRFTAERHRVYERRVAGEPGPWTDDAILRQFKFCNVYRAADRVSQGLIKEVIYVDDATAAEDLAFQIVLFRTFSNINTWRSLVHHLGRKPVIDDLCGNRLEEALNAVRAENSRLYTGAFILCATDAYGRGIKHLNHVELFRDMFVIQNLQKQILEASSLKDVYDALHRFPLMGDFMSYQVAIDLNYSELTDFSENDFTQPGPGALRGIKKVFESTGEYSPSDVVHWMVDRQEEEFAARDLTFNGLFGRPLQAIDVQNLFCETDKYCREALPDLKSARTRIKAKFAPSPEPLDAFFPPKWAIVAPTLEAIAS
ncbi:nucleotide kinase domain-containing protein [Microbacterium invictum]|uniref:DNA base hypermodification protein n=1 Tax=Microbacterium invictum TaxID=515415 RepID=A0ABZ0VD79_9MICO|nr:nucleotide kinase domain-containing protein [Microbacterium invictum]WQB71593.1 putative DNA base hypermodification protein [Microbacterium invictum]